MPYTLLVRPFNLIYVNYGLEILAFMGVVVSFLGMITCLGLDVEHAPAPKANKKAAKDPIESDAVFYEGFEDMPNPFEDTKKIKDPTLAVAEEMDKEKDRMDV